MIGRHDDRAHLFTNVAIFDGTGSPRRPGQVLVRGNRISAVAPVDATLDAPDAIVIDGGGRTLMPGLVEGHAHLTWPTSIERVVNAMAMPITTPADISERFLNENLITLSLSLRNQKVMPGH